MNTTRYFKKNVSGRGFTLLIAVVLSSVALAVGLALLDIAYKQVVLASATRQSQIAFYNADTAMECALYHDQQQNAFAYAAPAAQVQCLGISLPVTADQIAAPRSRTFSLPCATGGTGSMVTIYKSNTGSTTIFASGYNTCDAGNPRRIERGLKVTY